METRLGDASTRWGNHHSTYNNSHVDHSSHIYGHNINNINHHYYGHRSMEGPQDRLEKYVSKGAAHDSAERGPNAPKCFPKTREAIQAKILSFVDPGGEERILWLTGPAGAGKSAIAGSIADECHVRGWLAASFFLSASANKVDRCSKRYLISTLAYQLFQLDISGLPAAILAAIDANPSVFDKRLEQQVEILLLRPLREVFDKSDPSTWPKVVIVDGVDECDADEDCEFQTKDEHRQSKESNLREVLSALTQATRDPTFPFRIVIASRPDSVIRGYFSSLGAGRVDKVDLDSMCDPMADIELYLRAMLASIGEESGLPEKWYNQPDQQHWPSYLPKDVPGLLAGEASGQFIYAATVIRYLQGSSDTTMARLGQFVGCVVYSCPVAFTPLDNLYARILSTSPKPSSAALVICASQSVSPAAEGWMIRALLESSPGEIQHLLSPLTSLIGLVDAGGQPDVRLYHKCLVDFLRDPRRSDSLHVTGQQMWDLITGRCYEIIKSSGKQVLLPSNRTLKQFLSWFCEFLPLHLPAGREHKYDENDVDWWLANLTHDSVASHSPHILRRVHTKCHWYACLPACKVWRQGILRYAKANGWRMPTTLSISRNQIDSQCFNMGAPEPL